MMFEVSRTYPAPRMAGYEYMTDLTTWHEWAPLCIPNAEEAEFEKNGDLVAYRYRMMGVPIRGTMKLVDAEPGVGFTMLFEQKAFPGINMRWRFGNAGAHAFTLDVAVDLAEPNWWDKTYQRISMVPMTMKRDVRMSMEKLHDHFVHAHEVKKAS